MLRGRRNERGALDAHLRRVREGESAVLVVRGEAGVGKTALLEYVAERASGCRVVRVVGVESEMELAFAGLHQLCAPVLDGLEGLPSPQRDALRVAFGVQVGDAPDRFLVALATLSLLAGATEPEPLVCLLDDAQWLDRASAQTMAFVARRLLAERIAMVFAVREPTDADEFSDLPELVLGGLPESDARSLLASAIPGRLDERVRDQIVAETRGNPLALLELPRGLTAAELAGGFALPDARPLASRVEQRFVERVQALPRETQRLLLLAAAEPVGDVSLLWRAAERLGIRGDASKPAEEAALIDLGIRVRFRHPLIRSAAYRAALFDERQQVHRTLAEAIDPETDPDRRAWHRAHAASSPDEVVAGELARSADRARGRGGTAAAAAFLARAAELTPDPVERGRRALAAAQAKFEAGASDAALELLASAELGPLDE
ncbi:MAG TPA: BREX system ATP-binding domain-containing protein, partial [Solirubrobacteraceae bacterium]